MTKLLCCLILAVGLVLTEAALPSCVFTANGNTYDLSPLANETGDYIIYYSPPSTSRVIYINMCRQTVTQTCGANVGACQQWGANIAHASLGAAQTLTFNLSGDALFASYTGGDKVATGTARSYIITFKCAPNGGIGEPVFDEEDYTNAIYYFHWNTQYACTTQPPSKCSSQKNCDGCTTNGCTWCLDQGTCQENTTNCENWITEKNFCPLTCSSFTDCSTCTTQSGSCGWCLDNSQCISASSEGTCQNIINWSQFCPSSAKIRLN